MSGGAGHNRGNSKQNFATPAIFLAAVKARLQITEFAFDFAAEPSNAVSTCFWDEAENSLAQPTARWLLQLCVGDNTPGWGWLNPPFDDIRPWAEMLERLKKAGGRCAFLVPAAVGSNWWYEFVHGTAQVWLLNGRVPFDPDKPHWGYPKDLALCLYAEDHEPHYDVWRWESWVPADVLVAHKRRCTEARAREKAEKKAANQQPLVNDEHAE